jgi:uncharacterized membrane protein
MIAQLVVDTTISANWVIAAILMVLAFLLVRILNRIETKLEAHETKISEQETEIAVIKEIIKKP